MRVNDPSSQSVQQRESSRSRRSEKPEQESRRIGRRPDNFSAEEANSVKISERAKQLARIKNIVENTPDVRSEKVEQLKELIRRGEYKVDADAVADRMVKEHLET